MMMEWVSSFLVQIIETCLEVLRFAFRLHFRILWRLAICSIGLFSLPARALTALYTETLVEMQLHRLKVERQNLRKELEEQRKIMETMLMELEQQHNQAILKIDLLQGEVQDLKDETNRLKEALGSYNIRKSSWKLEDDEVQREVALSRSLFSALLSLVVSVVLFEAEDQCTPLVAALFTVVAISLVSVARTFTRIQHKPAFQAVALISVNWFILGTLVCPILPTILRFLQRTV